MKALTWLARRFVAGETAEDAVRAGRRLRADGIHATYDLLGEDVADPGAARRSAAAIGALLRAIPPDIERNVSIKLTQLGLGLSRDLCLELSAEIVTTAASLNGFVRIDMEGSAHTQATIDVFQALRRDFDNVGVVLQAYLRRTEDDIREAVSRGDRVRLCKGAYREPPTIAWTDMAEIRESFRRCSHRLLDGGHRPAIATHDETLIGDALAHARDHAIEASGFELQMLYGLRPRRWRELVAAGYAVRIYVPYGTHWMPYFFRRLRERKENVFFVVKSLLGG